VPAIGASVGRLPVVAVAAAADDAGAVVIGTDPR
jgi:hypothetical protein